MAPAWTLGPTDFATCVRAAAPRGGVIFGLIALVLMLARPLNAQTTWNGSSSGVWNTAGNWSSGVPSSTTAAVFGTSSNYNISFSANATALGLTFNSGVASGYTFANNGYTLTIYGSGITNNNNLTATFNGPVATGATQTWSAASGGLAFSNVTLANTLTLSGTANISVTGTLTNSGGSRTITNNNSGTVTFNNINLSNNATSRTLTLGGTGNTTVTGVISNASSAASNLTKSGTGTLTLSGANTYTGTTTVSAGNLRFGANNVLSDSTAVTVSSGATLNLANYSDTIGSLAGAGAVALGSGNLTAGSNNTSTTFSGVISGTGSLTKSGTGTLTLSGANTYTGATNVNTGSLRLGASNILANTTAVTVASGATLNLNNYSDTVGSLAGAGIVTLGSGTLTVGADNTNTTFSGVISGTGGITKTGTGTLILSGANTYTGSTTVNAGTLAFGAGMNLSSGTLVLNGGTLNLGGFNSTFGSLSVTANSILDFGTGGSSVLNILNSLTVSSGVTLTIKNWTDTVDYFYSLTNPGTTNLGRIVFSPVYSGTDTKWQAYDNEITPVPEPSTYGALLMSAMLALAGCRRLHPRRSSSQVRSA